MTTSTSRHIVLNVNVLDFGIDPSARKFSGHPPSLVTSGDYYASMGRLAERGTLDAFFLADHPALQQDPRGLGSRALEPTVILSAVAEATTHLGLIGTLSTTYNDPVEVAERILTLDYLSGGRAAWNAVTTYNPAVSANFGLTENPDRETRYRRAEEFVNAVIALWESAVTGIPANYQGQFFQFEGKLAVPASPQGHPLVIQAGGSPQGRALAGRLANGVFSAELELNVAIDHYEHIKSIAVATGRRREDVAILPGLVTVIGSTHEEASARARHLRELAPKGQEIQRLSNRLGWDLSHLDLDEHIPKEALEDLDDPQAYAGSLGFREAVVNHLRSRSFTLREALDEFAGSGHSRLVGTPEDVADYMETWFRNGAADGFNLMPDAFPSGLEDIVDQVVPLLRQRGIFRHEYEERTLRKRWGITPIDK